MSKTTTTVPKYVKNLCEKLDKEIALAISTRRKITAWMESHGIDTLSNDMCDNYIWDDTFSVSSVSYDALVNYVKSME